jgi:uncharacterized protein YjdB
MLRRLHEDHPGARIVYTGYYPIVDKVLSPLQLALLASRFGVPQAAFAGLAGDVLKARSESFDSAFRTQAKLNVGALDPTGTWLTFADPGYIDGDGLFGSQSKLFLGVNDPMFLLRAPRCGDAFLLYPSLRRASCPFASLGHPNQAGAQRYADAIEAELSHWAASHTAPKSLAITPSPLTLAKGDTQAISVRAGYADGSTGDASTLVTLASDNPSVATISDLTVRAVAAGQAKITATLIKDPTIKATVTVTVTAAVPKSLAITPASPLLAVGKNLQLAATVTWSDGRTLSTTATTWASGNTAAATVSAKGVVRGVAVGTASISATYKDVGGPITVTGSTIVTVLSGPPGVTGFTPASGSVGMQVTIQGANLLGVTSVDFGGVAAQFTVNSSSSITAVVPARAKTAAITVTSPLGTGKSKNKFTVR